MIVEVLVTGHNKGGLEVSTSGLRGFIPASQVSLFRVGNLEEFVGNKFSCVVTRVEPKRKNLILSRRSILEREREANKEKMLSELEVGQIREGTVSKIQPFGAFVDIGGIDGLVHVSKMSWTRINDPSEILAEGQAIQVKIERINRETGKISLSYRDAFENPWDSAVTRYPARSRVSGTVTRLTEFGAFVRLEAGIEGLLHVSEIAHRRVQRPSDVLNKDQQLEVQVLAIDPKAQRISLSLKALESPTSQQNVAEGESQKSTSPSDAAQKSVRSDLKGGTDRQSGGEQFGLKW
jgi:small subunit ribosomal protein S1